MSELMATAERLRVVKNAFQEFIELWAIDRLMEEHAASDRIAGDIIRASEKSEIGGLSSLYPGRGLDD